MTCHLVPYASQKHNYIVQEECKPQRFNAFTTRLTFHASQLEYAYQKRADKLRPRNDKASMLLNVLIWTEV